MRPEQAETIALQGLSFVAKNNELLAHFLKNSGMTPQDLKKRFREPEFLGGVLDAILADDMVLLDFCKVTSLSPETIMRARQALPGGYGLE